MNKIRYLLLASALAVGAHAQVVVKDVLPPTTGTITAKVVESPDVAALKDKIAQLTLQLEQQAAIAAQLQRERNDSEDQLVLVRAQLQLTQQATQAQGKSVPKS